jgi:hypothetical protein
LWAVLSHEVAYTHVTAFDVVAMIYILNFIIQESGPPFNCFSAGVFVAVRRYLCAVQKADKRFDVSVNPIN